LAAASDPAAGSCSSGWRRHSTWPTGRCHLFGCKALGSLPPFEGARVELPARVLREAAAGQGFARHRQGFRSTQPARRIRIQSRATAERPTNQTATSHKQPVFVYRVNKPTVGRLC